MKAIIFEKFGPPSVLQLVTEHPKPVRKAGELLVEVAATSINPVDFKTRKGVVSGLNLKGGMSASWDHFCGHRSYRFTLFCAFYRYLKHSLSFPMFLAVMLPAKFLKLMKEANSLVVHEFTPAPTDFSSILGKGLTANTFLHLKINLPKSPTPSH